MERFLHELLTGPTAEEVERRFGRKLVSRNGDHGENERGR
jgi:hypothetical protein